MSNETFSERRQARRLLDRLTVREFEVMRRVISGHLNKQIAAELGCSEKTVKVHRGRVYEKLAVRSIVELIRFADRAGIQPIQWQESAPL